MAGWLLGLVLAAGCDRGAEQAPAAGATAGHGQGPGQGHGHGEGHFADPQRYTASWNDPGRDAWQKPEEIVAAAGLAPGARVVDLGAGTGYLLPALSAAVGPEGEVVALDVEPAMLAFLDEAIAKEGWKNVRTHRAAYDDPGLIEASVDAVVTLNVWHHVEGRPAYAKRVLQALKPGGRFVVVEFLKEPTEGFGPPLEMRMSAEEVAADLRAGGFEVQVLTESLPRHAIIRGVRPVGG